jgi:hypothetical protein
MKAKITRELWIMAAEVEHYGHLRINVSDSRRSLLESLAELVIEDATNMDKLYSMTEEELEREISSSRFVGQWHVESRTIVVEDGEVKLDA